jgi:hypothetical protein
MAARKKWSELTPAYRARLQRGFDKGIYGQGYKTAAGAYRAGVSAQAARGQVKTSEAQRTKARAQIKKARAWSNNHSRDKRTLYDPPAGASTVEQGQYADKYLKAMTELEKGWSNKPFAKRKQVDWDLVQDFFDEYDITDFDGYFSL